MATSKEEVKQRAKKFHESLQKLQKSLRPLIDDYEKLKMSADNAVQEAKLDLTVVYAMNSLFWIKLILNGENPQEHQVKSELGRLKSYMERVKQLEEAHLRPSVNAAAAKRFVKNALFDPAAQSEKNTDSPHAQQDEESLENQAIKESPDSPDVIPKEPQQKKQKTRR